MNAVLVITFHQGDEIKKNGLGGNLARRGEVKNAYRIFIGKPVWMRSFGSLGVRWEYNIQVDLKEIVRGCVDCIKSASGYHRRIEFS